jgi:hypothetical protein
LLPVVEESDQIQVMHALLYAFSLPLPCRRVFYTELTRLLLHDSQSHSALQEGNESIRSNHVSNERKNIQRGSSSQSSSSDTPTSSASSSVPSSLFPSLTECSPTGKSVLSSRLLAMLSHKVTARLSSFLVLQNTDNETLLNPSTSTSRPSNTPNESVKNAQILCPERQSQSRRQSLSENFLSSYQKPPSTSFVVSSDRCIEQFRTLKGNEYVLGEDFSLITSLSWALDMHSNRRKMMFDMTNICESILGMKHSKTNDELISTESANDDNMGSGYTESNSTELQDLNMDLSSTGTFLSAVLQFSVDGFPLPVSLTRISTGLSKGTATSANNDCGSIRVSEVHSLSGESFSTSNSLSSVNSNSILKATARQTKDDHLKVKVDQLKVKVTHLACCYNLLSGFLRCLTLTDHAMDVDSSQNDVTGDRAESSSLHCTDGQQQCKLLFNLFFLSIASLNYKKIPHLLYTSISTLQCFTHLAMSHLIYLFICHFSASTCCCSDSRGSRCPSRDVYRSLFLSCCYHCPNTYYCS